jgi:N-acyl-D-aspartate/D-glutamate deacylase
MLERLARPAVRERIREAIARDGLNNFGALPSWAAVRIAVSPTLPGEAGRTVDALARARDADPLDVVCDLIVADRGATRILVTGMTEADVDEITATPWVLVGSDENAREPEGVTGRGKPHPRAYGTFARVLGRGVRERGLLTLPQAIHKMTGSSAAALGLTDRGVVATGAWADLAVFDPATIAERATYDDPHRYAVGVSTVVVNGTVVIDGGEHTGALPGRVLRFRRRPGG